jgi:hypothetical protein
VPAIWIVQIGQRHGEYPVCFCGIDRIEGPSLVSLRSTRTAACRSATRVATGSLVLSWPGTAVRSAVARRRIPPGTVAASFFGPAAASQSSTVYVGAGDGSGTDQFTTLAASARAGSRRPGNRT